MPGKRPRHPKLGYFINAAKKRKQAQAKISEKEKRQKSTSISDSSTPVESESEIESPSYSPLTHYNPNSDSDAEQANMDIDLSAHTDADSAQSSAGGQADVARNTRAVGEGKTTSSGGGMRGTAPLPTDIRQEPMRVLRKYRKQYLLRVQNELVETKYQRTHISYILDADYRYGIIRYPFHDLPVNMLGFYLSNSEIAELSQYTKATVKNVQVDVYNKTGVINFETASSTTAIGNNNIGIYLCELAKDINYKRVGQLPQQSILIEEVFWGYPYAAFTSTGSTDFTSANAATLGAQYVRRTLNNKFEYASFQTPSNVDGNVIMGSKIDTPQIPYFDIWPFVTKRINASMNEGHFATYNYQPTFGTVFSQQMGEAGSMYLELNNSRMPIWSSAVMASAAHPYTGSLPGLYNTGGQTNETEHSEPQISQKFPFINPQPEHYSKLEIENSAGNVHTRRPVPAFIIGIEPLTSEIATQGKWDAVQCHVDLLVQVELDMEIIMGTDYTNPNTIDIRRPDFKNPQLQVYNNIAGVGNTNGASRWASDGEMQIPNNQSYQTKTIIPDNTIHTTVTLPNPYQRRMK